MMVDAYLAIRGDRVYPSRRTRLHVPSILLQRALMMGVIKAHQLDNGAG